MKRFENKVVVVTGATRGIGKEIARAFAMEGATTIILGRDAQRGEQVAQKILDEGLKAESFVCDVSRLENVQEIANKILDKHKRVDILVNNAGITRDNLLLRMSSDDFDDVININLRGVFHCTKVFIKGMLKAKSGRIVNISSIIGIKGNAGQANYAASKAGIIGFTKSVAQEIASRGITVNAVAPGYIETDMTAELNEDLRKGIESNVPMERLGTPQDVAGACLFLASEDASYITGQTIIVDGGMAIK